MADLWHPPGRNVEGHGGLEFGIAMGGRPDLVRAIAAEYVQVCCASGNATRQVSYTEFRAHLATYLDRVEEDRSELIVTRQNHPDMVVMPLTELNSLRETLHLLSTPANAKRLLDSVAQLDAEGGAAHDLIEP